MTPLVAKRADDVAVRPRSWTADARAALDRF